MRGEPSWRRYLRLTRPDPRADVDDELRFHLQELERQYIAQGMSASAAQQAARTRFGDVDMMRETLTTRSQHSHRRMERAERWLRIREDFRIGARRLFQQPVFTITVVGTLTLGVGAAAAVFSVVNATLLRPLPYPRAERILKLFELSEGRPLTVSPPNFSDWRQQSTSFGAMAAFYSSTRTLTGQGDPLPVTSALVTDDFFDVMGVYPVLGRSFAPEELVPGQTDAAILSDGLWRSSFGAREDIIGSTIQLEGRTRTIVGVMPPGFDYPDDSRVWVPWAFSNDELATQRGAHYLEVVARLKDGVEPTAGVTEIGTISERLANQYPNSSSGYSGGGESLRDSLVGESYRRSLLILMAAVALVTLIACANVANLLLARGEKRQREMAVRSSLGARPLDLVSSTLTESVILAVLGGAAGIGLALGVTKLLSALEPGGLATFAEVRIDYVVLAFTLGLSVLTGLLFGIVPALHTVRAASLQDTLRVEGRSNTSSREGWRTRGTLIAAELALAVILLCGAGLLIRSFAKLQSVDPGFTTADLLTFNVSLPDARYTDETKVRQFFDGLREQIRSVPGVASVEAITGLPLDPYSYSISTSSIDGAAIEPARQPSTQIRIVTPDLLPAMGVRLMRGRGFSDHDTRESPGVILLNESAARLLFNGTDPLGHRMEIGTGFGLGRGRAGGEIVGIVADVHDRSLSTPPRPTTYLVHAQWPMTDMSIVVKGSNPMSFVGAIREKLRAADPLLPMLSIRTLEHVASESVARPRFMMVLLGSFGAVALALAAIGVFGVMSYVVSQRTREIGVRLALGAGTSKVVAEALKRALTPVFMGIAIGVAGALALSRTMASMLYDVRPTDPTTFASVAAVLGTIALLSAWMPARRASRVDPVVTLRSE